MMQVRDTTTSKVLASRAGLAGVLLSACLLSSCGTQQTKSEEALIILTVRNQPWTPAPSENFVGHVRVSRLIRAEDPSRLTYGSVEFAPGARTNWHTHPGGQLLIVSEGEGRVQEWGKPIRVIRAGDIVWTPPHVKHWHGASPNVSMTQGAATEVVNGRSVDWLERVSNTSYDAEPTYPTQLHP